MDPEARGIIYLVQPSELVGTNRYKIGCSGSPTLKRCQTGYRNGTRYICIMECQNPMDVERKLKAEFMNRFMLIAGSEFFSGNEAEMLRLFLQIVVENRFPENENQFPEEDPVEDICHLFVEPVRYPDNNYGRFVRHILEDKPDWFTPGEWLPKSILVEKFNERFGTGISLRQFMRCMNSEGLIKHICLEEKRARVKGHPQRLFLCKDIW